LISHPEQQLPAAVAVTRWPSVSQVFISRKEVKLIINSAAAAPTVTSHLVPLKSGAELHPHRNFFFFLASDENSFSGRRLIEMDSLVSRSERNSS
jgi:hypothetical protein